MDKDPRLKDPKDRYFNKFEDFAMDKYAYYQCYKCKEPYFGGMAECDQMVNDGYGDFKAEELVCSKCSAFIIGPGF